MHGETLSSPFPDRLSLMPCHAMLRMLSEDFGGTLAWRKLSGEAANSSWTILRFSECLFSVKKEGVWTIINIATSMLSNEWPIRTIFRRTRIFSGHVSRQLVSPRRCSVWASSRTDYSTWVVRGVNGRSGSIALRMSLPWFSWYLWASTTRCYTKMRVW